MCFLYVAYYINDITNTIITLKAYFTFVNAYDDTNIILCYKAAYFNVV